MLCLSTFWGHAAEVPWEPAPRDATPYWEGVVKQQAETMKQSQAKILFIGDSLTESWDKTIWDTRIAPAKALNFGIGGEGPQHVLWRIEHGILEGPSPETVVLMIGINNYWRHFTAAGTAKGIETIVQRIHARHATSRIVLLGLLPVYEVESPIRPWIAEINQQLKQCPDAEFHDLSAAFLEADGNQRLQLYQEDHLHLSKAGYIVLTRELAPVLKLPTALP
ncbi:GDSL-type esterase/lipase family protein [Prosthecobacter sp.]|uniref:GDSL-type esterase/lipase family protein n=1 Tax=Prosthecobacter sp. TaxID=1965333 RepID=UPI00378311FF